MLLGRTQDHQQRRERQMQYKEQLDELVQQHQQRAAAERAAVPSLGQPVQAPPMLEDRRQLYDHLSPRAQLAAVGPTASATAAGGAVGPASPSRMHALGSMHTGSGSTRSQPRY